MNNDHLTDTVPKPETKNTRLSDLDIYMNSICVDDIQFVMYKRIVLQLLCYLYSVLVSLQKKWFQHRRYYQYII